MIELDFDIPELLKIELQDLDNMINTSSKNKYKILESFFINFLVGRYDGSLLTRVAISYINYINKLEN